MSPRLNIIVGFFFVVVVAGFIHVESTTISLTDAFTSCTNQPLLPDLPNLSHCKAYQQLIVPNLACNTTEVTSYNRTFTWYYYQSFPVLGCPENECCFNTTTSIFAFTTVVRKIVDSNAVVTNSGTVAEGAYMGKNVTSVVTLPIADQTACLTGPGMQIRSGTQTLTIVGGPSCTGIQIAELCPGIH